MLKSIVNRWGNTITVGEEYRVRSVRRGEFIPTPLTVASIDTRSAYSQAYGATVRFVDGGVACVDDVSPLPRQVNE